MSELNEVTLSSEQVYDGRVVSLRLDRVRLPDGREVTREVVEHRGAVAIVPVEDDGQIVMVRQYRTPAGKILLEIPAGSMEEGEDPHACAQRELEEETGLTADVLEPLTFFYSAPGYCTEVIYLYHQARGLRPASRQADDDENIVVERVSLLQALAMVQMGEICDAKSIVGLLMVRG
ncbi:MAG: NUDIX hydrolase [Chloroflexi bacterium]|nr:NUDIX hydrolase [Chloroflexota bacterium]